MKRRLIPARWALVWWGVTCLSVGAGGCGTKYTAMYDGPKRPASEAARVARRGHVFVRYLDGKKVPTGFNEWLHEQVVLEVAPGPHRLTVGYYEHTGHMAIQNAKDMTIRFDAAAGKTYHLVDRAEAGMAWYPVLLDPATKQVVARPES